MKITTEYNINDIITYDDNCSSNNGRIIGIRTTTNTGGDTKIYYELNTGAVVSSENAISPLSIKSKMNDFEVSEKYLRDQGV